MICPNCNFVNPENFKFCGQCGTSLLAPARPREQNGAAAPPAQAPRPQGQFATEQAERRQLTVMFCDLVGSTALSSRLDPEDLRDILRAYHETCGRVINLYEGYIAQYLGDGVLFYFGFPRAHEDDVQHAVRSALEIIEALASLNVRLHQHYGVQLEVRLGIHTGLVVVGAMGLQEKREALALGETPNVAARLQTLASPNTVLISASTFHLVHGYFDCEDAGTHRMKGIAQPMQCYRVLRWRGAQSSLDVAARAGLTPLVGKAREIEILLQGWQKVQQGQGQAVLLQGEAGIGKSRLTRALLERIGEEAEIWECRCSPYHQNSALYPVADLLQRVLHFQHQEPHEKKLQRLTALFADLGLQPGTVMPPFATLLSVPLGELQPSRTQAPECEKQMLFLNFCSLLVRKSCARPLLLIAEDLHWADPSTLELLGLVQEKCGTARVFLLATARPVFHSTGPALAQFQTILLNRLNASEVRQMIVELAHERKLPEEVAIQIIAKTDGVPLFVEELTKMLLESNYVVARGDRYEIAGPLPALAIPTTLHDSLMARLDRLAAVKEVAQVAATIGREFQFELLRAVWWPHSEGTLREALAKLVNAELLLSHGEFPHDAYSFKHALIQDAAYQSLLKSKRQFYHYRIAQVLTEQFLASVKDQPELMAHHYTEAGMAETAVEYWLWAGQQAITKSAHLEASAHLRKGLELLNALPASTTRDRHELSLLSALGVSLVATRGYAAPEAEETYTQAWQLCERLNDTRHSLPVLLGLWQSALLRTAVRHSLVLAGKLMVLARQNDDQATLLTAYLTAGVSRFYHGDFLAARADLEHACDLYNPSRLGLDASMFGQDPGVVSLAFLANALWFLGYPEQARQRMQEALNLSETLDHPFTRALALSFASEMEIWLGEIAPAEKHVDTLLALAREQNFPFWLAHGTSNKGQILLMQGRQEQGIAYFEKARAAFGTTGSSLGRAGALARLAEEYCRIGKIANGLALWEEAQQHFQQEEENAFRAEMLRVHGVILQAQNLEGEAEAAFQQAFACARNQAARAWELRAALALSRLWLKQGQRERALTMLQEAYYWFTEGFGTKDLHEAKILLEKLRP